MRKSLRVMAAAAAAGVAAVTALTGGVASASEQRPVNVQLLNITDLHGYLWGSEGVNPRPYDENGQPITAGGLDYLSAHLKQLRHGQKNSIFFSAGDSFSGWDFTVDAHENESTIEALNALGLQFSAAGNHEFDQGTSYLKDHIEKGTCFGKTGRDSCFTDSTGHRFHGADFPYYSANIVDAKSGKTVLPPYNIEYVRGSDGRRWPVGFINITIPNTPTTGVTSFQPTLAALDELQTVNKYAELLHRKGVGAIVANLHDGGAQSTNDGSNLGYGTGYYNGCTDPFGAAFDVAKAASPYVNAFFTGHWHESFNCSIPGPDGVNRPVIEANTAGQLIAEVDLKLNPKNGKVLTDQTTSANHVVSQDITPDPAMRKIMDYWQAQGTVRYEEPLARQTGDFTRTANPAGESTMGDLTADIALWSADQDRAGRADLAMMVTKPLKGAGAVKTDLLSAKGTDPADADGRILFGEAWNSFGFGNPIVTAGVTGKQIQTALEQQWQTQTDGTVKFAPIAVSKNVSYTADTTKPVGGRVGQVLINGKALDPAKTYRLAVESYTLLAADGVTAFTGYTDAHWDERDREAIIDYLRAHPRLGPAALNRVQLTNAS